MDALDALTSARVPSSILLLMADRSAAAALRAALESRGYQVRMAYDGLAGLAASRAGRFDLLVVDLDSAGLDGTELIEALAPAPGHRPIPIMALASPQHESGRLELFRRGVDDVVPKSISPLELVMRVRRLLKQTAKWQGPRRGRVTVFLGAAGGVGTTTICANVAQALGSRAPALALDLAWPLGGLAHLLSMPDEIGILELSSAPYPAAALPSHLMGGPPRLAFRMLPGISRPPGRPSAPIPAIDLVTEARSLAGHVLVDLGTAGGPYAGEVVADADTVVLIVGLERTHFVAGRRLICWLDSVGGTDSKRLVVGNRTQPSPVGHRDAQRTLEEEIFLILPHEADRLSECLNSGRLLVDRFPGSPAAIAIAELASAIDREASLPRLDVAQGSR